MGPSSPQAAKLFVIAGIFGFVDVGIALIVFQNEIAAIIAATFGVFFLFGAFFASRGTMVDMYAKLPDGSDDLSRKTGEYSAACYCGLLGPLAMVLSFVSGSLLGGINAETILFIVTAFIGGLVATIAGIVFMRTARREFKTQRYRTY